MVKEAGDQVLELLTADHDKVRGAFHEYQKLGPTDYISKKALIDTICSDLKKDDVLKKEILYPAVLRGPQKARDTIFRAINRFAKIEFFMGLIQSLTPQDHKYDSTAVQLFEHVEMHATDVESEIFPLLGVTSIHLPTLGQRMAKRKEELYLEEVGWQSVFNSPQLKFSY